MMIIANRPLQQESEFAGRRLFLLMLMMSGIVGLAVRAIDLQVIDRQFLKHQADIRHVGVVSVPAHRGRVLDRKIGRASCRERV